VTTTTRREFLGALSVPVAAAAAAAWRPAALASALSACATMDARGVPDDEAARDEDFWAEIQQAFTVDRSLVNFNNGGVSPAPAFVQEAMERHLAYSHQAPAYTMWRVLEPQRETVRARLAGAFGCDTEEVAITRNASESLQICQLGFDLSAGDEIVTTNQDYPRMINTFRQRERREGIVLRQVSLAGLDHGDDEGLVARLEAAITPRTRLVLVCHMINLTGRVLPVRAIVAMGRRHGLPVIVDGAHAFAHIPFTHADLECDYYGVSLHKWLFAPHGTGLLYVRRDRIRDLWPLMAAHRSEDGDIRKFEQIGTHPAANALAIAEALTFHEAIGGARKAARLVFLRDRWARRLLAHDRVRLHTSLEPGHAYGIATVQVDGVDSGELAAHLWSRHRILVTTIDHDEFEGVRVSPSVYATPSEVDRFGDVLEDVVRRGIPA